MPCALPAEVRRVAWAHVSARRHHLLALPLLACACAAPPPAIVTGTLTARAMPSTATGIEAVPTCVRARLLAVAQAPNGDSPERAASAIASDRGAPFRATSALPPGCSWLAGEAAIEWLGHQADTPVLADATGTVDAALAAAFSAGPDLPTVVCEPAAASAIALRLQTKAAGPARTETLFVREPLPANGCAVLFVPMPHPTPGCRALVLQHTGPATAEAVTRARAELPAAPRRANAQPNWRLASDAIGEHNLRPALLALARAVGANRCIDVLLAAEEPALVAIGNELDAMAATRDPVDAFAFERAAWRGLLPRLERDELAPGLCASVARSLGAVADDATTLRLLLMTSPDATAFAAALRNENVQALADRDVRVRAAAHEWLLANGTTIAGYDPFGTGPARSNALRAFAAEAAAEQPR